MLKIPIISQSTFCCCTEWGPLLVSEFLLSKSLDSAGRIPSQQCHQTALGLPAHTASLHDAASVYPWPSNLQKTPPVTMQAAQALHTRSHHLLSSPELTVFFFQFPSKKWNTMVNFFKHPLPWAACLPSQCRPTLSSRSDLFLYLMCSFASFISSLVVIPIYGDSVMFQYMAISLHYTP